MQYGLQQKTIDLLLQVFEHYPDIEKVILYGSRAKGNYRDGSDIDLAVVAPKLNMQDIMRMETEIDDLLLPYKLDISLLHQISNEDLRRHIDRVGIVFYPE
jgi:predicted nucleotidyltransferase